MSLALILAGGGAKGSYQAHVASKIYENREVTSIAGVSAGALNGSVLSQGKPKQLQNIWKDLTKSDVWSSGHSLPNYFNILAGRTIGFYDPSPLLEILEEEFDPESVKLPFRMGATSIQTGKYRTVEVLPSENYSTENKRKIRRFAAASSAIPILVKPVEVEEEPYVDGGVRNIAPIGTVLEENPDRVALILNSPLKPNGTQRKPSSILGALKKTIKTALNETIRSDLKTAQKVNEVVSQKNCDAAGYKEIEIDVIEPPKSLGSGTDFSAPAYEKRIEAARRSAEKYLS